MDLNRSTSSGHVSPNYNQAVSPISFVVTGPTSLVRSSVCSETLTMSSPSDKRLSTDTSLSLTSPKIQLTVPATASQPNTVKDIDRYDGALSDSEVGRKKSNKAATVGHSAGSRFALRMASKENALESSGSMTYDTNSLKAKPTHRTLQASDSVSTTTKSIFGKKTASPKRPSRRISCKELGNGQCQGWLLKKKEAKGLTAGKWSPRWCVIHNKSLYYYKTAAWDVAEGVIYLPGFLISPAAEIKHRKFAFKAHHPGMTFYFAAERQDDMSKWMNKMALATLGDTHLELLHKSVGTLKPELRPVKSSSHLDLRRVTAESDKQASQYYSESDDTQESQPPSQTPSRDTSTEDITDLYRKICDADLDLAGSNVTNRRSTIFMTDSFRGESLLSNSGHDKLTRKLLSLKRTLKDKEQRLSIIEQFLELGHPVTSDALRQFNDQHPDVVPSDNSSTESLNSSVNTSLRLSTTSLPLEEGQVQMRHPRKHT